MPSRNVVKNYRNGAYFHAYNRGVDGQQIFRDDHDRNWFMHELTSRLPALDVALVAFALMPNHFHLVLKQLRDDGISRLMQVLSSTYTRRFNGRHNRYGSLFQGKFRASGPHDKAAARKVIAYTHLNPIDLRGGEPWERYEFSSHTLFTGDRVEKWFDASIAEDLFVTDDAYSKFMRQSERRRKQLDREVSALWTPIPRFHDR